MDSYSVYMHTSPSGKVYIGITKVKPTHRWGRGSRYKQHPHFYAAIQKYGWDQFKHEVLFSNLTKEQACEKERELIEEYKATDRRFGYNEKTGGETGVEFNESICKKISESQKKRFEDPKERELCRYRAKGRKHTEEERRKMSIAKTGTHFIMTEEWKENISKANKNAYKEGTAAREIAVKRCVENGMKNKMPVEQCDLELNVLETFESMSDAARKIGINGGNISRCCNGRISTAGGFKWRFATES